MRVAEYTPELALDAADVRTTRLTTNAAAANPVLLNIVVKGLCSGSMRSHGVTIMITPSDPM